MDMFGRGFKSGKCKTLLRLAMSRIKLLRNKREIQLKVMRREIANLLQTGQEPSARIRVEHIFREQNIVAAYEIVELFCELVVVRLPIIESQKQCPLDLKEAIASLIFAAPRCSDLPELLEVRGLFAAKYGKDFVAAASELRPDCGVNRRIIEKLSVRAPSGEVKLKLLQEIAAAHNVDWDPKESEAELSKQHEDLLDGPSQFVASSQRPLPTQSQQAPIVMEPLLVEEDDLPSVPVRNPVSSAAASRSADTTPLVRPASPPQHQPSKSFDRPASPPRSHKDVASSDNVKQFVPFLSPHPSQKLDATPMQSTRQEPEAPDAALSTTPSSMEYRDVAAAAQAAAESAERAASAARAAASLAKANFVPAPADDSSDSDAEMEVPANVRPTNFSRTGSQQGRKSFRKEETSSDSEDEQFLRGSKPEPQRSEQPRFDAKYDQEDDEDALWKRPFWKQQQPESKFSFSPPRAPKPASWSGRYDDNFGANAEDRLNSQSSTESSLFKQDVEDVFQHQGPGKQHDISPTSSLPRFDEPEPEEITPFPKAPSVFQESRSFKSQQGPPQRRPPDVPRPPLPEAPSPKTTLSPSGGSGDSGGSGSFGVHPKLPDYEELAARFQALKTSKR